MCISGYHEALSRHVLKRFLLLVLFLDRAKLTRLFDHNPCLFQPSATIKVHDYKRNTFVEWQYLFSSLSHTRLLSLSLSPPPPSLPPQSSRDVLLCLSRKYLAGEGDIIRHLSLTGYTVTQIQVLYHTIHTLPIVQYSFNSCSIICYIDSS